MTTPPLMEVRHLRKTYGERVVIDDVSLTVHPGDVVCLIGSSGSGKSTLLRCLDLLEPVDDGVIEFEGREVSDPLVDPREVPSGAVGVVSVPPSVRTWLGVIPPSAPVVGRSDAVAGETRRLRVPGEGGRSVLAARAAARVAAS